MSSLGSSSSKSLREDLNRLQELSKRVKSRHKHRRHRSSNCSTITKTRKPDRSDQSISDRLAELKSTRIGDRHTELRVRGTCRKFMRKTDSLRTFVSVQSLGSHSKVSQSSSGVKSQVSDHSGGTLKTS